MKKGSVMSVVLASCLMLAAVYLVGWGNVAVAILSVIAIKQLL